MGSFETCSVLCSPMVLVNLLVNLEVTLLQLFCCPHSVEFAESMAVLWTQVKQLWDCLSGFLGLAELSRLLDFEYENIRESFLKLRCIWDYPADLQIALEMIQILTVLQCMTFYARMGSEDQICETTTFVEAENYGPRPHHPCSVRDNLRAFLNTPAKKEMTLSEVNKALKDLDSLIIAAKDNHAILNRFNAAKALLQDVAREGALL